MISRRALLALVLCAAAAAPALAQLSAPDLYRVRLQTTKGDIVIEVDRTLAPRGADRFYALVSTRFYDGMPWFRVMTGFMAQTGISPDPAANAAWRNRLLRDDPVKASNVPGMVTFAMGGPDSRSTHFFINTGSNTQLDKSGFAPFGKVVAGMDVVQALYAIGDSTVDQGRANAEGEAYFKQFGLMDRINKATVEPPGPAGKP